ncbi:hypothetical protein ACIQU4_28700 [Streptomyces sp. NPDC090741]|uniref:hypothetical protein n=1 Tax=Streptomyces sp. NPDC090741 TaxID=3365967 RepID=UPI00382A851D
MDYVARRCQIDQFIAAATPDQLRAAIRAALAETSSAHADGPDVTSYGIDGTLPRDAIDAGYSARRDMADDIDAAMHAALTT